MDRLDRYLVRETLIFLVLILAGLTVLFLGIDFLTNFWRTSRPMSTTLLLYGYRIPSILQLFLPMSCLMATLLVLSSMSRQNEILALYAGGIGRLRILSTFVACVACVSTFAFLLFDPLLPMFARKTYLVQHGLDPASSENLASLNRSDFWHRSGNLMFNVGQYFPQNNTLHNVNMYMFTPGFYLLERVHAKEAQYVDGDWVLKDGMIVTYPPDTLYPQAMAFETKRNLIPEKPKDFQAFEIRDDNMLRLKELRQYIRRNRVFGFDMTSNQVNYQERVALVFTPLVMVLLGLPFGLQPLRNSSNARSIGFCFATVLAYLLLSRISLAMGKSGSLSPIFAAWSPNLLFLSLAAFRLGRGHGSS